MRIPPELQAGLGYIIRTNILCLKPKEQTGKKKCFKLGFFFFLKGRYHLQVLIDTFICIHQTSKENACHYDVLKRRKKAEQEGKGNAPERVLQAKGKELGAAGRGQHEHQVIDFKDDPTLEKSQHISQCHNL